MKAQVQQYLPIENPPRLNLFKNIYSKLLFDERILFERKHIAVSSINPYSYLKLYLSKSDLNSIDHVMIDGSLMVWILRLFGHQAKRISPDMSSVAKRIFEHCNTEGKRIYFWGTHSFELTKTIDNISEAYPQLNVVGSHSGFYPNMLEDQIITSITSSQADYVFIGMGSPKQERVAAALKADGFDGVALTCGGFLHQTSKRLNYYPAIVNKLNLRWIYRIYDEPKLIWRYLVKYPIAIGLFLWEIIGMKTWERQSANPLLLNSEED